MCGHASRHRCFSVLFFYGHAAVCRCLHAQAVCGVVLQAQLGVGVRVRVNMQLCMAGCVTHKHSQNIILSWGWG